jgi:hypothetical protein
LASARLVGPDGEADEVALAPTLSAEHDLELLRVLWVRAPGDTSGMSEAMGRTEASIRRLMPERGIRATFSEILVPRTLDDLAIPMPPPDWQQIVVEPRDRPRPSSSDSYWDADTPPRQGLHVALIVGGILGGTNVTEPSRPDAQAYRPWVVHPFTRAVLGAARARSTTRAVLHDRLADISAADVAPESFYAPEAPEDSEYLDEAAAWLRDLDGAALRFHRPTFGFEPRGQSFLEFLGEVARFVGWALVRLFGPQRWRDAVLAVRARIARRLEADDYGATIDADAPTPAGLGLEDWDAREAEAQTAAGERITAASRADGRLPRDDVWMGVARLVPALIDGSSSPKGWMPRERFGHRFVVPARLVARSEPEVLAAADAPGAAAPVAAELRGVKRIGRLEMAHALELVRSGLGSDLASFSSPRGRVTKTAQAIADHASAEAARIREEFAASLPAAPSPGRSEAPLLVRVRAGVVSDLVLDVLPKLQKMLRDATWMTLGTLGVAASLIAILVRFGREIDAVFSTMQLAYPTSWTQLLWWILTLAGGVLVAVFTRLFYVYHAYNEVGRRRLEYAEGRAGAAVAAYDERNRLRNAERILSAWEDVLSSLGDRRSEGPVPPAAVPSDLPDSLQVAEPDIDDDDLSRLVVEEAIEPGWYGGSLAALLEKTLGQEARDAVWADVGLPGGPLHRLRESALEGEVQHDWWDEWCTRVATTVVARLSEDDRLVRPVVRRRADRLRADDFHAEITRPMNPEYRPGSDFADLFESSETAVREAASARQRTRDFTPTPPLTSVETVLVLRRLARVARQDPGPRRGGSGEARKGRA